jgi:hypothetical protein
MMTKVTMKTLIPDHGDEGIEGEVEDVSLAASSLAVAAVHSALCAGQCARMQAFPQK